MTTVSSMRLVSNNAHGISHETTLKSEVSKKHQKNVKSQSSLTTKSVAKKVLAISQERSNSKRLNGSTELHFACRKHGEKKIQELLCNEKEGVKINTQDSKGKTPLHITCKRGSINSTRLLIESGARLDLKDNDGKTALDIAFKYDKKSCAHAIVQSAKISYLVDRKKLHSLYNQAVEKGWSKVAHCLQTDLTSHIHVNNNQERQTIVPNYEDALDLLIYNATKRHIIDFENERYLPLFCKTTVISILDSFIKDGFDLNKGDEEGNTFLIYLIQRGCLEFVDLLLSNYDVDVNKPNNNGVTPLHLACEKGYSHVVWLLSGMANVTVYDKMGLTPLHYSIHKELEECSRTLMNKGATFTDKPGGQSHLSTLIQHQNNPFYRHLLRVGQFNHQDIDVEESTEKTVTSYDDEPIDDASFDITQFLK